VKYILVAVAALTVGCNSTSATSAPEPTGSAVVEASKPSASAMAEAPKAGDKKLITITTKSPEAKEALLKSWDLSENGRNEEALEACKKAVAADPDFALAHTTLGGLMPGAAAQAELDTGARLGAKLPEAERVYTEIFAAARRQEMDKYYAGIKRLAEVAPDDFRAQVILGNAFFDRRDFPGSEAAFKKALLLNPRASFVNSGLTAVYTQLRKYEDALGAAKKYAAGAPDEAGAHQGLAGALLNMNQTKEAVTEAEKAVSLAPKSRQAYYDLATVKAIAGDYPAALDALEKSKATEAQPTDALDRQNNTAWVLFGQGKEADALAALAAADKDGQTQKLPWPGYQATVQSVALWALGKSDEALKAAEAGLALCASRPESSESYKAGCHRDLLSAKAFAQIQAGKIPDAKKTVAELVEEAKKVPDNNWFQTNVSMLSDQVAALESKDPKAGAALYAKCPPDDFVWKLSILRQAQKANDKDLAEQVRKDLLGRPVEDLRYPLIASAAKK
jgi:tetratricopeptide (TPR) repeat protein